MIFVGMRLTAAEARTLLARLQDPCHEMTGSRAAHESVGGGGRRPAEARSKSG